MSHVNHIRCTHVTFVHLIRFTCDVCTSDTVYMWRLYIWYGLHVMFVHLIRFTCDTCTSDTVYMWCLYIWYGLHVTFVHLIRLTCDVCTSDTVYMWGLYIWYGSVSDVQTSHVSRIRCTNVTCKPYQMYKRHM
jgi:hypothetical protein